MFVRGVVGGGAVDVLWRWRQWRAGCARDERVLVVGHGVGGRRHRALEGLEEGWGSERVGQSDAEDSFAKAPYPVSQCRLVGMLVIVGDGRDAHEPFVCDGADGRDPILHREMDVAGAAEFSFPPLSLAIGRCALETLDDEVLGVIVPPSPGTEFGEDACVLQQLATLDVCPVLLISICPVFVTELEVRLTCQRKQWDLVEYSVQPSPADIQGQISNIVLAASIFEQGERGAYVLRWSKTK